MQDKNEKVKIRYNSYDSWQQIFNEQNQNLIIITEKYCSDRKDPDRH